jgi:hypothetical protein
MSFIQTYTGRKFYPLDPRKEDVDIQDIAHALSLITRFTGHTRSFYSVAQHSVLVSWMVQPMYALQGLLHDASEAYLADLASPVKIQEEMAPYRAAEQKLQKVIFEAFGVHPSIFPEVHSVDKKMLMTEARDMMNDPEWAFNPYPFGITPWTARQAKRMFLREFRRLTEKQEKVGA